jgi:hypothetical protein
VGTTNQNLFEGYCYSQNGLQKACQDSPSMIVSFFFISMFTQYIVQHPHKHAIPFVRIKFCLKLLFILFILRILLIYTSQKETFKLYVTSSGCTSSKKEN